MGEKLLETIKQEFTTLINNKKQEVKTLEDKIKTCEAEIVEINKSLEAARLENNVDKYDQGKRALWTATNTLEMYKSNLEDLKIRPLVTREVYDKYERDIESFAKQEEENMLNELQKISNKLEKISDQSIEHYNSANELLRQLEKEIGNNFEDFKYEYRDGKRYGLISNRSLGLEYKPKVIIKWLVDEFKEKVKEATKWI